MKGKEQGIELKSYFSAPEMFGRNESPFRRRN